MTKRMVATMKKQGLTELQVRSFDECGICNLKKEIVGVYYGTIICDECLNDEDGSEDGSEED